jgi:hypothetical protein
MPTIACLRQRGSVNSSPIEPRRSPLLAAFCQLSGSLSRRNTRIASSAGSVPTTNMARQALPTVPLCSSCPSTMPMSAAIMLPIVDAACTQPSANGRAAAGTDSATSATPTANCPPTPRPVRNRYALKSQTFVENTLRPVKSE